MEKIINEIYQQLYKECGVDFDYIDKSYDNWFLDYFLAQEKQDEIVENTLKTKKLSKIKKQTIRNSIWLGCAPSSVDFYWQLERTDGLIKQSLRIKWIEYDEKDKFKDWFVKPKIGRSLVMSPFSLGFTWMTTLVTEILEESFDTFRFKTENSEYILKRILKHE